MNFIDQIVTHIIRPTRELYRIGKLGPKSFILKSKITNAVITVNRQDIPLINPSKQKIQTSHFTIQEKNGIESPAVIYLHGNNGSRNQGMPYIRNLLENQIEVVLFDFSGSGLSEGDVVTLGANEAEDVAAVVEYLKTRGKDIFLWGRSMGAVASLIYLSEYPNKVRGVVVDSPFSTLRNLIKQLASTKTGLPQFFFQAVLPFVDKQFQTKTGVSFDDLQVSQLVGNIKDCAALFITSENDQMVKYTHSEAIFKNYQGPKQIQYIKQQHHEVRNKQILDKIIDFFKRNSLIRQQTAPKQTPSRQNNFVRLPQSNSKILQQQSRQATNQSGKKIRAALIQTPAQKISAKMAYYQPPQKVSMAYLTKFKPQNSSTLFYRQSSNRQSSSSIERGSGIRSHSSQYRISSSSMASHTPKTIHSRSVIKYLTNQDGLSKMSQRYITKR